MVTLFSLQRHFAVFAISFPGLDALKTIYLSILNGHINALGLPQAVQKNAEKLVDAALAMNQKVCCIPSSLLLNHLNFFLEFQYSWRRQSTSYFEELFKSSIVHETSISHERNSYVLVEKHFKEVTSG